MAQDQAVANAGPTINTSISEVQGLFPSDAAMQDAISRLSLLGCDRADFSIPNTRSAASEARPEAGAENPETDVDNQQMRTMSSSMAGATGAIAAAGVIIATGGAAAVAAAAAVAVGAGAGLAANAASTATDSLQHGHREQAAADGRLVLTVRLRDVSKQAAMEDAMRQAGATEVAAVTRNDAEISSTSWTGM